MAAENTSIELQSHQDEAVPPPEDQNKGHSGGKPTSRWLIESPEPPSLWQELVGTIRTKVFSNKCMKRKNKNKNSNRALIFLKSIFPILSWARNYNLDLFKKDLMSGLTIASLSIPQSIGYATLAKVDPEYGLYTSMVPPLIYAVMGSSRDIAIGPVAVVSLLLSSLIQGVQDPVADPLSYRKFVFTVTFFAGAFQTIFGLFRLGFLVDFLSHASLIGFMSGAAIVIGLQQLKGLFGLSHFTNKTDIVSVLSSVFHSLQNSWQPLNFVIGFSFLIFILVTRFIGKRNKKLFWVPAISPLISVILATLIVYLTRVDKHGVKIVQHIKRGINPSSVHQLQLTGPHTGQALKIGLIVAIIALTEAIAVGRSFASMKGYHLDGNKEMIAIGFANIVGSLTSCYAATGAFSRTAVNVSAGCETAVSNIVMAITVMVSLELLTKLLYYTPVAILASIIISALPGLIDLSGAYQIWKLDKFDFLSCAGAFLGVLFASVEIGLLIAVGISFAKIILSSLRPGIEVIGRLPKTDIFCDINQFPVAIEFPEILALRISSSMFCFANATFIRERVVNLVRKEEDDDEQKSTTKTIQAVILDMSCVMSMDTSALIAFEDLRKELTSKGIKLAIANPRWRVLHKLKQAKFEDKLRKENIFLTVGEAVDAFLQSKIASLDVC